MKNKQKGKIKLKKIKYFKENTINIISNKFFKLDEKIKLNPFKFSLEKIYPKYRREGVRLGRGKSKIKGFEYRIRKEKLLLKIKKLKEINNKKIFIKYKY